MTDLVRSVTSFEGLRFDITAWPVVHIEFPEKRVSDKAMRDLYAELEAAAHRAVKSREMMFIVTDLTLMRETPAPSQRKESADWMRRTTMLMRSASVGGASVTPSALLRGIITAVSWVQSSSRPMRCFGTRAEAYAFGENLFREAKLAIPPTLAALAREPSPKPIAR